MQRIGQHPATTILRFVNDALRIGKTDRNNPILIVEDVRSIEWASITFTGQRHEFDLRLEGKADSIAAAIESFAAGLGDADVPMVGHFLAEIAVASIAPSEAIGGGLCAQRLRIDALTVRD